MTGSEVWDVVVVGGGNAALVSALTAADRGMRVLLIERADRHFRGGNSRHTRNIRCVHGDHTPWNTGAYRAEELWRDLCSVGEGPSREALALRTVELSEQAPDWMTAHDARFQQPLRGTLHLGRTNTFFLGGGKALMNSYYRRVERLGVRVDYDSCVTELRFDGNRCTGLHVRTSDGEYWVRARAVVCASGGFEANLDWLAEYWGDAASNFLVRGTPFNDGMILRCLLQRGARPVGVERGFHSVAIDARSPRYDGGIATRIDSIPFGIVVNEHGARFYDEGEDIWPKRYAIWGSKIASQPGQIAYCLWDAKVNGNFLPPMYGAAKGATVADVCEQLGLDPVRVDAELQAFNAATPVGAVERFDPSVLDGVATSGLSLPKSNWAQPIDTAPFYGIALRPGITFTYLGVAVAGDARIELSGGGHLDNVFAAGEIMSGNILSTGYLAGFGMTIGTVWGRIAGDGAADYVAG